MQPEARGPYVFLSHRATDKPLLERFISRVTDEGVAVFIDRTGEFGPDLQARAIDLIQRGLLRSMVGGKPWTTQLPTVIDEAACTIGFISQRSYDEADREAGSVAFDELVRSRGKLVTVELDAGAVARFAKHYGSGPNGDLRASGIGVVHFCALRESHFDHDYDRIGEAVAEVTGGRIGFGTLSGTAVLTREQAALAARLRGSPHRTSLLLEGVGQTIECRLVPAPALDPAYFWLSAEPVTSGLLAAAAVESTLAMLPDFRLPTAPEIERALAPLGRQRGGPNPFGLRGSLSDGVWADSGRLVVVGGNSSAPTAALHVVYKR
ncbi:MAG: toll/interleukin-1 receptor domain-containing protein [Pseudomonadota bacterium]